MQAEALAPQCKKEENCPADEAFLTSFIAYYHILPVFSVLAAQMAVPGTNPCHSPTSLQFDRLAY
jgi:hypothetical protein